MRPATQLVAQIVSVCPLWLVPPPLENRQLKLKTYRNAGERLLLTLEGVSGRSEARELVGRDIVVERTDVPKDLLEQLDQSQEDYLDEDSFGLGYAVTCEKYGDLGSVKEVIVTGANLVWVVDGSRYGEVLLPVIDDCILEIDHEAKFAKVRVMKGLIDEN